LVLGEPASVVAYERGPDFTHAASPSAEGNLGLHLTTLSQQR
jgi:hypothetical protein